MTTAEVAKILTSENNRQIWFKVQDSQLMIIKNKTYLL